MRTTATGCPGGMPHVSRRQNGFPIAYVVWDCHPNSISIFGGKYISLPRDRTTIPREKGTTVVLISK